MALGLANWSGNLQYSAHTLHQPASVGEAPPGDPVFAPVLGIRGFACPQVQAIVKQSDKIRDSVNHPAALPGTKP